ncbi:putative HTH-type transcriptional regulator YbbH [Caprobacter fermentans]|uniref:Putative HTH-type transcriptional regulator YbbH n=1 Tax=Caproicibacter fermentans TaxID=2576756 RepID=A0A6N8HZL0_9FIRM|nr:MurR/RpiR family transcriptional regulator [Caproicibacter fermentans]MVB10753.1 putative HTH-type transcriptional regulator YbbH [Caproicibacter fermentans]
MSFITLDDNIFLRLRGIRNSLTPVERTIEEYVFANKDQIPHLSVKGLAQKSHTSDASVLRFCKTLGYRGYRDFIVAVSAALGSADKTESEYTDIQPGDDLQTIITNVSRNNRKSIEDTMSVIDRDAIGRAVELLRKASRIDFYGIGASGLVCMDAQQKFTRIGKTCFAYTDGHSQLTAASILKSGDVAVLISNSGDTLDILNTLEVAKESKATIIAITRYVKSELANEADLVLNFSTPEITIRSGAMGSRIAMLNIVDILFTGVASANYKNVKALLTKTHNVLAGKHKHLNWDKG